MVKQQKGGEPGKHQEGCDRQCLVWGKFRTAALALIRSCKTSTRQKHLKRPQSTRQCLTKSCAHWKRKEHWESEHKNDEKMWSELWAESIVSHLFSFPGVIWLQAVHSAVIIMEAWLGWHIKRCKWGFQDFLQGRIYVQRKNKLFQLFWSFGELIVRFGLRIGFNMSFNKKFCLTYFWLLMCFWFCFGHPTQPITKYHFHPSIHPILKRGVSRPKDRSAHPSISALESISDSQNFARQSFSVVGLGWGWLQAADRCACFALFTTTGYDPKTLNIEIGLPSHPIHSPQRVWKFLGVNSW